MELINIQYDASYETWENKIREKLVINNMLYYKELPSIICTSLQATVMSTLRELGYKPKNTLAYRHRFDK